MDVLKAQLARIQEQIGQLTASQRMLAFSLIAVMVLTLLFWGRYAGTAEMEPVLAQSLKGDEIARITAAVASRGVSYKVVGDRVLVPADRKLEVLAQLSYDQVVPQNTRETYDEAIAKISPWDSDASASAKRTDAKAAYLAQVIRHFPGVARADVVIDATNEHRIGGSRVPTASVHITTRTPDQRADKALVRAAAATVAGAQSGLAMSRVTIVVNGATYPVRDQESGAGLAGDEILSRQQEAEKFYAMKVSELLTFIPGVLVAVQVDIDGKAIHNLSEEYDPSKVAQKESQIDSETVEETSPAATSGEPGVSANTSVSLAPTGSPGGAAGGPSSTKDRTQTKFEVQFSKSKTETVTAAGKPRAIGAVVRVPRSYFVNAARAGNSSSKEPDETTLTAVIQRESEAIRRDVRNATDIKDDANISVSPYPDTLPLMAAASESGVVGGTGSLGSGGSMAAMFGSHAKEIALGVLALLSLFFVRTIVKSGVPAPVVVPPPPEVKEAPMLSGGEEIAGDVGEGGAMLDGMELDESAVQAQQMVEQVSTMVKENPEAAATLVKRWLNRS